MNEYVFELLRVNKEINGRITFQQSYKKIWNGMSSYML